MKIYDDENNSDEDKMVICEELSISENSLKGKENAADSDNENFEENIKVYKNSSDQTAVKCEEITCRPRPIKGIKKILSHF